MIRDVRFILMGTGTSAGVPIVGCECHICTSDDPRDKRLRCSACLQFVDAQGHERVVLIDTSPDLREQSLRLGLKRCDGIVYTHSHVDHTFGLDEVRRFNVLMDASIDIWADELTMQALHRIYKHIFDRDRRFNSSSFVATLVPHLITPPHPVDILGLRFTPLKLLHGGLPILGYRIEALDNRGSVAAEQPGPLPVAYCTDTSAIPPDTWPQLRGLRTLILDMLRPRHHPTHLSVDEAVAIADQVGAEQTRFIHMTHNILHAELEPTLPEGMKLGYDGLVLD